MADYQGLIRTCQVKRKKKEEFDFKLKFDAQRKGHVSPHTFLSFNLRFNSLQIFVTPKFCHNLWHKYFLNFCSMWLTQFFLNLSVIQNVYFERKL